jgi:hypothetical protein
MFPALRYDTFDVKRLQRVFASQREYGQRRIDLYMGSFDGYWLEFFAHLSQRILIRDALALQEPQRGNEQQERSFWNLVCHIHHRILHDNPDWNQWRNAAIDEDLLQNNINAAANDIHLAAGQIRNVINSVVAQIKDGMSVVCVPILQDTVQIFGELRSNILEQIKPEEVEVDGRKAFSSVPYNANLSFLIYRKDLFNTARAQLAEAPLATEIKTVFEDQRRALRQAYPQKHAEDGITDVILNNLANERAKSLLDGEPPETWEELIALCAQTRKHYLIETQTFDTVMCSLLEMIWSFGGDLEVRPDYSIGGERTQTEMYVFRALYLLRYMFLRRIVTTDSTMDVLLLEDEKNATARSENYLFGRHWYSTIVNILTARKADRTEWLFYSAKDTKPEIEICQIPVSLLQYKTAQEQNRKPTHHSSWGVWHFGILAGSENSVLASRLINHFMSSHKICEMASAGAIVPTAEAFYYRHDGDVRNPRYADRKCLDIAERPDIKQPDTTYGDLYDKFFTNARSRSRIFNYRNSMQELHGVVESIRSMPLNSSQSQQEKEQRYLSESIRRAFDAIVSLRNREMMD